MKTLYFMRHGLTELNAAGLFAGRTETPLTDTGRAQARLAGAYARTLQIDTIACSTMGRAIETAEIVANCIQYPAENIYENDLLVERDFGQLEGQPYFPGLNFDEIVGTETTEQLFARAAKALEWVEQLPGDRVLIVGHGSTGRALRHIHNPSIPFDGAGHFPNAEIVELQ